MLRGFIFVVILGLSLSPSQSLAAEGQSEAKAEAGAEAKAETGAEAKAKAGPEAKAETGAEAKAKAGPEAKAEAGAEAQTEPEDEGPIKVLLLDPKILNLDEKTAKLISSFITAELSQHPTLDIISGEDMRRMMELEAEKQTVGCDDNNNCLAELAGALGADLVIYGELGKLGNQYMLQQSLFNTKAGKAMARISVQSESVDSIPGQLRPKLRYLVKDFLPEDASDGGHAVAVQPTAPAAPDPVKAKPIPLTSWVLYGSGGLGLIAGSVMTYLGSQSLTAFDEANKIYEESLSSGQEDPEFLTKMGAKEDAEENWNALGQSLLWGGVGTITLSAVLTLAGLYIHQEAHSE